MDAVQPSTVGDLLRSRRQQLGLSLEEIASRTRIRRLYLEALEKNLFETLPGDAYLNGFLRSYAGVLGLEADSVLRHWREQTVAEGAGRKEEASFPVLPVAAAALPVRHRLTVLLLLLAAPLVAAGIFHLVFGNQGAAEANVSAQPLSLSPAPVQPVLPSAGSRAANSASGKVETAAAGSLEARAPSTKLPAIPAGGSTLRLESLAPLMVAVEVDTRPLQRYALGAASVLQWNVDRRVRLAVDAPESANVWLGDEPFSLAGRSEVVLQQANSQVGEESR